MGKTKKVVIGIFLIITLITGVTIFIYSQESNKDDLKKTSDINSLEAQILDNVEDIYSSYLPAESIYATSYIQSENIINLADITELYESSDLVIVGTIKENLGGKMLEELGYAGILCSVQVDNVIKGELSKKEMNFFTNGGYCTIEDYVEVMSKISKERVSKLGFDKLSDFDKKNNYLVFNNEYGKKFDIDKRYVLMLKKINDKYICLSKYGFLEVEKDVIVESLTDILNLDKQD
jgi:hypothetical protein